MTRRKQRGDRVSPTWIGLPDGVRIEDRHVQVGDSWRAPLAVSGYPQEVRLGWLEPLVTHPGRVDVALHVTPIPAPVAADRLRRQRARLESSRRIDASHARLPDVDLEVAAEDACRLAERLARGDGRLFSLGVYATAHGDSPKEVKDETARLRAVTDSMLLDTVPTTFRAQQGWITTLPFGVDQIGLRRTVDTDALAAAFPFAAAELSEPAGVLYGRNTRSHGLVFWDRFAQPNYNAAVLARSGAGKSYLVKLEVLRSLYRGVHAAVIDPEDEYARLARAVGGAHLRLGQPGVRINPFDLTDEPDALERRALFAHTLINLLVGALDADQRAALDRAVLAAYRHAGITGDPATHARPAPLLADVGRELLVDSPSGAVLAGRLDPYITGTHRGLFDGPTSQPPTGHLVVFSLRDLPDELKAAGTLLVLDTIWRTVTDPTRRRRRLVVVDEAWLLMRDPAGARFLLRLAKSARKHWCGLTVVTQDAADLLGSELGQAVVANAATQILLRQAPQTLDALADAFRLSEGEQRWLLAAQPGQGILLGGLERVAFDTLASPDEHRLVTTNPAETVDEEQR
jgi:type IV secretory pathway VirB4 component